MKILSENSVLNVRTTSTARRVVSLAIGATVGITLGLTSVHADQPSRTVLSGFHSIGQVELASVTPVIIPSANPSGVTRSARNNKPRPWYQVGLASWYGQEFQGRETASGEDFNMNDLTCAHRTLPLGTWVKITNLHNRKWVVARVNDRGPVPETRVVDLSSETARMLGMRQRGVSRVRLDVIDAKQAIEVARVERLRALRAAQALSQTDATQVSVGSVLLP
ncbi:MAG TPA: septal ring lytic transglycosylase RlpA family protein [Acidobacteriaceae bacterium]|jgi:rare lipoprotein A|nr:septal ring lytic transglycosylase RlpA family protein [Acidobacteriaceae bacterium]